MILLISNLPYHITPTQLCTYFESFGTIHNIYMPITMKRSSPYFGCNKGHAFLSITDAPYLTYIATIDRPLYSNDISFCIQLVNGAPPSHKGIPVMLQEVQRIRVEKHMKLLKLL